jgi:hypothetical protein
MELLRKKLTELENRLANAAIQKQSRSPTPIPSPSAVVQNYANRIIRAPSYDKGWWLMEEIPARVSDCLCVWALCGP